jgi:hypothetical protein
MGEKFNTVENMRHQTKILLHLAPRSVLNNSVFLMNVTSLHYLYGQCTHT